MLFRIGDGGEIEKCGYGHPTMESSPLQPLPVLRGHPDCKVRGQGGQPLFLDTAGSLFEAIASPPKNSLPQLHCECKVKRCSLSVRGEPTPDVTAASFMAVHALAISDNEIKSMSPIAAEDGGSHR